MTDIGELKILVGSSRGFEVLLVDNDGNAESLSGYDHATLSIKTDVDASTDVLLRTTTGGNLTIDVANSKLVATLTQVESDALVAGHYIGQAAFRITGGSDWHPTDRFRVVFEKSFAPHTP